MNVGDLVRNGPLCGLVIDLDPEYSQCENLRSFARESNIAYIRVLWGTGNAYWENERFLEVVNEGR